MRRVWAVARNTFISAMRMKTAMVFMLLLIVLLPLLCVNSSGDGTIKGRLQSFVSYGLGLVGVLLSILTIIVSCYSLSSDIKGKQIYMVATKPLRRFEIVLGKLFGVLLLDGLLLLVFASVIYALAIQMPRMVNIEQGQTSVLQNEFFTARKALPMKFNSEEIEQAVKNGYTKLLESGELDESRPKQDILKELRNNEIFKRHSVGPGSMVMWEFDNVAPSDANEIIFIRFKYDASQTPADNNIRGLWYLGDYRQIQYGSLEEMKTPIYQMGTKKITDTIHEISFPANAVAWDGYLAVVFQNEPMNNTTVIFPIEDGLEVLYKAGSFSGNFLRVTILLFLKLAFLAGLGVSLSAWLSFPVAILCSFTAYCVGTIHTFVIDSFTYMSAATTILYNFTIKPFIWLLPKFDGEYGVGDYIINARQVSVEFLSVAAVLFLAKALIILAIGILIFSRREIAKITV
ncbi:MAG: hypothetical protein K8R02_09160 [Anaerohalosphaeraceae bacterium]|nr:hypothetical protein [Anaerohalosphaeraceae bacterium]